MPENNVRLGEQPHWKNRDGQAQKNPAGMGAIGHGLIVLVALGLAGGGWIASGRIPKYLKDQAAAKEAYKNGSKEVGLYQAPVYFASSPSETCDFDVYAKELGIDFMETQYVKIPVPNITVELRQDGRPVTTIRFSIRTKEDSSYDDHWERATILVPTGRDLVAWQKEVQRIRDIYDLNFPPDLHQVRRVMPRDYKEENNSEDHSSFIKDTAH